ncbi:TIGR02302 family protein [Martelella lutilitoris]|uniref:TIGR02302 family protein n=1 Tax=Martelella lutilitoris TaxID=2583532 RepID=A0A5C4JLW9_9HYPH|nr:TIGR02302 family protein [Martelella lutilitoris]TNB46473.1 TIGR02302 family protein [Martelella lutilitoris]
MTARQQDTGTQDPDKGRQGKALMRRIARGRAFARFNLVVERLAPGLVWPACALALYLSCSWLGLFHAVPFALRIVLLLLLVGGFFAGFWPLRRFKIPTRAEAERRLERENGLAHQAVSVAGDRPARETPEALALWHAHQRRMAEKLGSLDPGHARADFSAVDPYGLRAVPALLLFVAFLYSGATGSGRLADAFLPPAEESETALALRFDAWISPPPYTRQAPVYLQADGVDQVENIPEGSVLTVRLSGEGADAPISFQPDNADAPQAPNEAEESAMMRGARFTLSSSGLLEAAGRQWMIGVVPDELPVIAFKGRPRAAANGALELEYTLTDDYGVTAARAEIAPSGGVDADATPLYPPPEFPLNMPSRSSADHSAFTSRNLTEHPLSGKPVTITLVAEDAAGHVARSAPLDMVLPARNFYNLLAGSVAEQRQIFALDTRAMPEALQYSAAITLRPEETIPDLTQFLLIKSAQTRMLLAHDEESYLDTAEYLWEIATGIEDGALSDAERRLREAQDALSEALRDGASDAEIARLMEELRQAMQEYLSEMAERMQPSEMQPGDQQALRQRDLDNLLNQLENLARSGDRAAAQQLLSELQRMMNNIQPPSSMAQQGGQQNSEMREQIDKLGELIQEQQRLMNETFELDQQLRDREQWGDPPPRQDGEQSQGGERQRSPQEMTAEELREALRQLQEQQQALSEQLGEMQEKLSELGMPPAEGFGRAGEAMDGAAESLGEGEGQGALEGQGNALEALRQGAQQMMNSMMAQGQGQQGQQGPNGQTGWGSQAGRDPLGRNQGTDGLDFGDDVQVPDEFTVERAREILDAIRERLNEDAPLPSEPPYLERLLEPDAGN